MKIEYEQALLGRLPELQSSSGQEILSSAANSTSIPKLQLSSRSRSGRQPTMIEPQILAQSMPNVANVLRASRPSTPSGNALLSQSDAAPEPGSR